MPIAPERAVDPAWCDFFQAVRLLHCGARAVACAESAEAPTAHPPVRFAQSPTLAFPTTTLAAVLPANRVRPATVVVNFFGLLGANGPMPLHWTERVCEGARRIPPDAHLIHFLDLFHDRLLWLYYRAWAQAQPVVALDGPPAGDDFARWVSSLAGVGLPAQRERDAMPDEAKRAALAISASGRCSVEALARALRGLLGVPVEVRPWQPGWLHWPPSPEAGLGRGGIGLALAAGGPIGRRVSAAPCHVRIVLGPLVLADFLHFQPGEPGWTRLTDALRHLLGLALACSVQCMLRAGERPPLRLGRGGGARLGAASWLGGHESRAASVVRACNLDGPAAYGPGPRSLSCHRPSAQRLSAASSR